MSVYKLVCSVCSEWTHYAGQLSYNGINNYLWTIGPDVSIWFTLQGIELELLADLNIREFGKIENAPSAGLAEELGYMYQHRRQRAQDQQFPTGCRE